MDWKDKWPERVSPSGQIKRSLSPEIKTEIFILLEGDGLGMVNGHKFILSPNTEFKVNTLERHTFFLKKDSILFCVCSEPYNKNDD